MIRPWPLCVQRGGAVGARTSGAMTMCVALCVIALHFYFNTFKDKMLDEMIDKEVREIKTKEDMKANLENVAMAVMKSGTEDKVRLA